MSELNFSGNCLKGSRPVLSFDAAFEKQPHLRLIKEVFLHVFGVPQGARRSKPFIDHVMGFSVADGRIWVRNYQISESEPSSAKTADGEETPDQGKEKAKGGKGGHKELDISLVEIGPRFVITPSKSFTPHTHPPFPNPPFYHPPPLPLLNSYRPLQFPQTPGRC